MGNDRAGVQECKSTIDSSSRETSESSKQAILSRCIDNIDCDFAMVRAERQKVILNKSIAVGFCILELSKLVM